MAWPGRKTIKVFKCDRSKVTGENTHRYRTGSWERARGPKEAVGRGVEGGDKGCEQGPLRAPLERQSAGDGRVEQEAGFVTAGELLKKVLLVCVCLRAHLSRREGEGKQKQEL